MKFDDRLKDIESYDGGGGSINFSEIARSLRTISLTPLKILNDEISAKNFAVLPQILPFVSLTGKNGETRKKIDENKDFNAEQYAIYLSQKWSQYFRCLGGLLCGKEKPLSLQKFARFYLSCDGRHGEKLTHKSRNEDSAAKEWLRLERGDSVINYKFTQVLKTIKAEIYNDKKLKELYWENFMRHGILFLTDRRKLYRLIKKEEIYKWATTNEAQGYFEVFHRILQNASKAEGLECKEQFINILNKSSKYSPEALSEIDLITKRFRSNKIPMTNLRKRWEILKMY